VKLVRLEECRAGQKAARDVYDGKGNLLFKAGTRLTPELAERLKRWKVTHLLVEEEPGTGLYPAVDRSRRDATIEKELDLVFSEALSNPIMKCLRDAAARYLKGRVT